MSKIALKTAAELGLSEEELEAQTGLSKEIVAEVIAEEEAEARRRARDNEPCMWCGGTWGYSDFGDGYDRCNNCKGN